LQSGWWRGLASFCGTAPPGAQLAQATSLPCGRRQQGSAPQTTAPCASWLWQNRSSFHCSLASYLYYVLRTCIFFAPTASPPTAACAAHPPPPANLHVVCIPSFHCNCDTSERSVDPDGYSFGTQKANVAARRLRPWSEQHACCPHVATPSSCAGLPTLLRKPCPMGNRGSSNPRASAAPDKQPLLLSTQDEPSTTQKEPIPGTVRRCPCKPAAWAVPSTLTFPVSLQERRRGWSGAARATVRRSSGMRSTCEP
jgi:hypothetical protein